MIDTSPLYGMAELNVGHFASALGINDQMFVSNKVWATGEFLRDVHQGEHNFELSRERLWRDKIDLMQCHNLVNVDIRVPLMKAWKKEGRIKYLGVTHYETPYFEALADWVEKGDLDFVQVHYSIMSLRGPGSRPTTPSSKCELPSGPLQSLTHKIIVVS